jgi:hypothetical protein
VHADANREKCGSPDKIDDRESQQSFPRRGMGWGFDGSLLPALYQLLIAQTFFGGYLRMAGSNNVLL